MDGKLAKNFTQELLTIADITINGNRSWDIKIHNERFYSRVLNQGILGLGESYMDHWWECSSVDEFIHRILSANLEGKIRKNYRLIFRSVLAKLLNFQTKNRAFEVGKKHYDLGNSLFESMLDSRLNYTCGYWKNASTLEQAQIDKLELVCQKLLLKPGMRLLDIGCGWGGLAQYAAEKYGVSVVGVTISEQQYTYAKMICAGLPVEIRFQDYRDIHETFDRIASLGMFEHVGHRNYKNYLRIVNRCLTDNGLFLLHSIGSNITYFKTNPWIDKYIFPNGALPSIAQIGAHIEKLFVMEDWHNFGADYDKTLLAWHTNFNNNWYAKLSKIYDERFFRMWNFYLLLCAGSFRARDLQLWQIVLSKNGIRNGYQAVR